MEEITASPYTPTVSPRHDAGTNRTAVTISPVGGILSLSTEHTHTALQYLMNAKSLLERVLTKL